MADGTHAVLIIDYHFLVKELDRPNFTYFEVTIDEFRVSNFDTVEDFSKETAYSIPKSETR